MSVQVPASEILKRRGNTTPSPVTPPVSPPTDRGQMDVTANPVQTALFDIGKGAIRSLGKGVLNVAKLGKDALDATAGAISGGKNQAQKQREEGAYQNTLSAIDNSQALKSKLLPQSVADVAGDIVTTILPFAKVGKAAEAATALMKSRKIATLLKIGLDAAGSAGLTAAISNDGERLSNAKSVGGTVGALGLAGSALAPVLKKAPEELYRATYKDTLQAVKKDKGSLAQWALSNVKPGSLESQRGQIENLLDATGTEISQKAKEIKKVIPIPQQLVSFAKGLKAENADFGQGEVSAKIGSFLSSIKNGEAPLDQVVSFKSLVDRMRTKGSFMNTKIGDNLAYWTDHLRGIVNEVPELAQLNAKYTFGKDALEAVQRALVKNANRTSGVTLSELFRGIGASGAGLAAGVGGLPALLLGGGMIAGSKALENPSIQTGLARGMQTFGKAYNTVGKPAVRATIGGILKNAATKPRTEAPKKQSFSEYLRNRKRPH